MFGLEGEELLAEWRRWVEEVKDNGEEGQYDGCKEKHVDGGESEVA